MSKKTFEEGVEAAAALLEARHKKLMAMAAATRYSWEEDDCLAVAMAMKKMAQNVRRLKKLVQTVRRPHEG